MSDAVLSVEVRPFVLTARRPCDRLRLRRAPVRLREPFVAVGRGHDAAPVTQRNRAGLRWERAVPGRRQLPRVAVERRLRYAVRHDRVPDDGRDSIGEAREPRNDLVEVHRRQLDGRAMKVEREPKHLLLLGEAFERAFERLARCGYSSPCVRRSQMRAGSAISLALVYPPRGPKFPRQAVNTRRHQKMRSSHAASRVASRLRCGS